MNDMNNFQSLVKKEALHVMRDYRTLIITVLMPVVLLLLFGFAISTEVNDVKIVAVVDRHTDESRELIQRFCTNEYFDFLGLTSHSEVERLLRSGKTDAAVYIRQVEDRLDTQIVIDASNTTSAQAITGYIQGVINGSRANGAVLTHTLYNPEMKSSYNFVPGIMGMIFILICAIMTSVSIVREKETGTLNLLLVSPIRPYTIILGKLVPYFALSCLILVIMLVLSYAVLGLPFSSGVVDVVIVSIIYVVLSLSLGLLVSTLAKTQLTALIASAVVLMLPVIMLSGMIFPIDNMPPILQGISCIIPARWYIDAMRKIMIQGLGLNHVAMDVVILSSMTLFLLVFAIRKFQSITK